MSIKQAKISDRNITIYPEPGEGISIGAVIIPRTDQNKKLVTIHEIIKLNNDLGNEPINSDVLISMDTEQLVETLSVLQQLLKLN